MILYDKSDCFTILPAGTSVFSAACAEYETQVIELNSTDVKPLFGKEPMVKVPRNMFDSLLENYKAAKTYKRMYESYYAKCSRQDFIIQRHEATIQELTGKVKQLTDFIEAKGLVEAFKEFLNPKKDIEKVRNDRAKKAEQRITCVVPPKRKKSGIAR